MILQANSLSELPRVAQQLIQYATEKRVWLFYGEMGAGKTTLIKAICEVLGVSDVTSSPTFSLVNEYQSSTGPVFHFDFYRIKSEQEAFDLGYEEYFYSSHYCFVEWPELIPSLIPADALTIRISTQADLTRLIEVNP